MKLQGRKYLIAIACDLLVKSVLLKSQTCSGNFSGNQRHTDGFSCIPGLSRCVRSTKQALMLKIYSHQLLSSEAGKEPPLKSVFY